MDIETRLHGRRSYRKKCDLHQAGGLVGGMQASYFRSDPDASDIRLPDHPPSPALASSEPCVPGRNTSWVGVIQVLLMAIVAIIQPAAAASVNFDNCMSPIMINSERIQFIPLFVNATLNSSSISHNLNITVYGNVTGRTHEVALPPYNDSYWQKPNETEGKIPDVSKDNNKYTTLTTTFNVLDYTPYNGPPSRFCNSTVQRQCPLIPAFDSG